MKRLTKRQLRSLRGQERDDAIVAMYVDNGEITLRQIGAVFGLTFQRIQQILEARKVPRRRRRAAIETVSAIDKKRIKILRKSQWTIGRIAQAFHLSDDVVAQIVGPTRGYSQEIREQAAALYAVHRSTYKVGEILGVSDESVRLWLRDSGLIVGVSERAYAPAVRRKAIAMCEKKISISKVAKIVGVSSSTVGYWWRESKGHSRVRDRSSSKIFQGRLRSRLRNQRIKDKRAALRKSASVALVPELVVRVDEICPTHERCACTGKKKR